MSFSVLTGGGGLAGWAFLNRTGDRQRELVANEGAVKVSAAHFRKNIGSVKSADDLLSDYRMLKVTLGAFGLQGDLANKAFIRKILESDLSDKGSLANRLSDKSYLRLAESFGLGAGSENMISKAGFADGIISRYVEREFEARVGESDDKLRLALNARRELAGMADRSSTNDTKWYEVLGNSRLRKVFEGAFGFGSSYGKLPIDRQLKEFKAAAAKMFGTDNMAQFAGAHNVEKLMRNYLVRSSIETGAATNRYATALTLLSPGSA
ncbi:MAG: DUF1217 domain-containing protein [Paracoccus sp. (in: a-proteobacteria)]|nr:DUF1217 domain-containing protein [Paracoccus sp. (in: a-proteobacteria)]